LACSLGRVSGSRDNLEKKGGTNVFTIRESGEKLLVAPTGDPWAIAGGALWLDRDQARELARRLTEATAWTVEETNDEDA